MNYGSHDWERDSLVGLFDQRRCGRTHAAIAVACTAQAYRQREFDMGIGIAKHSKTDRQLTPTIAFGDPPHGFLFANATNMCN